MSFWDVLRFAAGALRGHKLRTGLSMVGVAIGVGSVILLTALGEGARVYVTDQFMSLGTNILIVVPGRTDTTGGIPGLGGAPKDLTIADAEALRNTSAAIEDVAPMVVGNETVSSMGRSRQVMVVGTTEALQRVRNIRVGRGRFLPESDWERGTSVTVIGRTVAEELFPGEDPVGKVMRIGDFRVRVIGVMAPRGMSLGIDFDSIVMLPLATGMRLFNRSSLFRVMIKHDARADVEAIRAEVTRVLQHRHDGDEDFTIITQDAVMGAFSQIFAALTAALAGIAAISLSVAGIGIMNVMLVSVSERTHEIGLLKAVGAHPGQILSAFLVEAALLSGFGGLVGLGVAALVIQVAGTLYPGFSFAPPVWATPAAVAVSLGVGMIFGVLPARRATQLDPIAALRS